MIVLFVALLATGCGDHASHPYPSDAISAYIESCVHSASGGTSSQRATYCSCTIEKIEQEFSYEDYLAQIAASGGAGPPKQIQEIQAACIKKAKSS